MAVLDKPLIDPSACPTHDELVAAFYQLLMALGFPAPDPGPGVDGTVPDDVVIPWVPGGFTTAVKMIYGEATASVSGSTFTIDTIVSFTAGYEHPTSTQLVNNLFEVEAPENQRFLAVQIPDDLTWWAFTDIVGEGGTVETTINVITAKVNESGGVYKTDATFAFDNATAILGTMVGTTGTATNFPADEYFDDEDIILVQADDNSWVVIRRDEPELVPVLIVDNVPEATIASGEIEFGVTPSSLSVLKLNGAGDKYVADTTASAVNILQAEIEATAEAPVAAWAYKRREGYAVVKPIETVEPNENYVVTEITSLAIVGSELVLTYKRRKAALDFVDTEETETVTIATTTACP